ncbi:hypothetical protein ABZY58_11195 [Micromonospora tulbaghiae]|uniref:hypothetical protein n=1 Tax=Micromonospora tulbaghiae TaxID=479978 RepID=UPI0033B1A864
MTDTRPLNSADWHARRAEDLTDLARSASMAGPFKRGRRRDMLAAARVHATLGAVAMPVDRPAADVNVRRLTEQLAATEGQRETATTRARLLEDELEQIRRTLGNYGLTVGDVLDVANGVERLLEDRYVGDPGNAQPSHPAKRMPAPKGFVCPACQHSCASHREHGCDAVGCDCPQPFGRIMPGDPSPTAAP